jgi:hypothetical protein
MQMLRRAVMANPELLGPMLQVRAGFCKGFLHVAKVWRVSLGEHAGPGAGDGAVRGGFDVRSAQQQGVRVAACV